jgi:hypothetical protein
MRVPICSEKARKKIAPFDVERFGKKYANMGIWII